MNALTIFQYLFGNAAAIRRIASSPMAVPAGLVLVVSAGAARNYDQVLLGASPAWFTGPLVFSLVSGAWICFFVCEAWIGVSISDEAGQGTLWRKLGSFFGLFWMTAPIAWLYAIPVERWCEPVRAAQWNVTLLAVVSLWRVLLMGRVVSVIGEMPWWRALGRVLVPASVEVIAVSVVTGFGPRIMTSMAGLRNSPAEEVMLGALDGAIKLAFLALFIGSVLAFAGRGLEADETKRERPVRSITNDRPWRAPWIFLALTGIFWAWLSIKPQQELKLSREAINLAQQKNWAGLVSFLSQHRQKEFAPSVVLPPSPWEIEGVQSLPAVFSSLTPQTSGWVRTMIIDRLDVVLDQEDAVSHVLETEGLVETLVAAEKQPEGPALIARHSNVFAKLEGDWMGKDGERFDLAEKVRTVSGSAGE